MRHLFTTAFAALATLTASATDYTDVLNINVNGTPLPAQQKTISFTMADDSTATLSLTNLVLVMGTQPMGIGTIELDGVKVVDYEGVGIINAKDNILISAGDAEGINYWMGPQLGPVPIRLVGEQRDSQLYFTISIDMTASLGQSIAVTFGNGGYQIGNSDFELFHTATAGSATSDEPNHWHSFMSATGALASFVSSTPHTFKSDVVRPGSMGTSSVLVTSSSVFGSIVANGTITTGRMCAGAMSAADPGNHAYLDLSESAADDNGDPFYSVLNGCPDSIAVWVKFKQGTPNADYPYATLSAVVTDGTRYQDPEDPSVDYTNIVAKAANHTIASNDFQWQRIVAPFDFESYEANEAVAKAILVTISTNAEPGSGSGTDSLYVDDLELIYNLPELKSIYFGDQKLTDITPTTDTYTIVVPKADAKCEGLTLYFDLGADFPMTIPYENLSADGQSNECEIVCYSKDLKLSRTISLNILTQAAATGIANVPTMETPANAALYNLRGQRISNPVKGQVYIKRLSNGKTVKVVAE